MTYTLVDGVVVHPFPCEDCDWLSCDVDDDHVTWQFAAVPPKLFRVHLCSIHMPYAEHIIRLAKVSATLNPGRAQTYAFL